MFKQKYNMTNASLKLSLLSYNNFYNNHSMPKNSLALNDQKTNKVNTENIVNFLGELSNKFSFQTLNLLQFMRTFTQEYEVESQNYKKNEIAKSIQNLERICEWINTQQMTKHSFFNFDSNQKPRHELSIYKQLKQINKSILPQQDVLLALAKQWKKRSHSPSNF